MKKFIRFYKAAGLIFFNFVLGTALLLLVLWGGLELRHLLSGKGQVVHSDSIGMTSFSLTPPDVARRTALEFDDYANQQPFVFNPWTTFMLAPFDGRYLNVVEDPILNHRKQAAPSNIEGSPLTVWCFGGSTLYGFGVPDDQTIPAHLQHALSDRFPKRSVRVVNFGQPYWFSSSEVAIYAALLRSGRRPDAVIFFDGLNDVSWVVSGYEVPVLTPAAEKAWERARKDAKRALPWISVNQSFPLFRVVEWLRYKNILRDPSTVKRVSGTGGDPVQRVLKNYRANRKLAAAISRTFGVAPFFILQPAPWYGTYRNPNLRTSFPFGDKKEAVRVYDRLIRDARGATPEVMYTLHDRLFELDKPYLDSVHYSDKANKTLAEEMARIVAPAF